MRPRDLLKMGCGTSNAATSNVSQPSSSSPPPPQQQQSSIRRGAHHPIPPLASIPLSPVQPYRHGSPITQGELNNARNEFWSTRVEGHQQIWQTLRSVAEAILSEDLPLANAILEVRKKNPLPPPCLFLLSLIPPCPLNPSSLSPFPPILSI